MRISGASIWIVASAASVSLSACGSPPSEGSEHRPGNRIDKPQEDWEPSSYVIEYQVKAEVRWLDSPSRPRETGVLRAGETVWLREHLAVGQTGMALAKLSNGKVRYIVDVSSLER